MTRDSRSKGRYGTTTGISRYSGIHGGAARRRLPRQSKSGIVFIGPSVDGSDKEYIKVLSGEVDRRKPSFA